MLARLIPKNERFFGFFKQAAEVSDQAAQALLDLVENFQDVERKVKNIRDIEHQGDDIAKRISEALTQTFVTPIDREDIVLLADRIDELTDTIEDAARRMWLYRVSQPTELTKTMAKVIANQAKVLAQTMPMLEDLKMGPIMIQKLQEVKRLEDEADALMDKASLEQFDGVTEVKQLIAAIRWGEIYQLLEDASDRAQDVAKALEEIALKHS